MANLSESRLFSSAEDLTQANREAGWRIEYRQLMPGSFSSEFAVRGCPEFLVMRERFLSSLEIRGQPPEGVVTGIITGSPDQRGTFNGEDIEEGRIFVMLPGSELDVTVLGGVEAYSFFLPQSLFLEAATQANMSSVIERRGQVLSFQAKQSQLDTLSRMMSAWLSEARPTDDLAPQTLASNVAMNLLALSAQSADPSREPESCGYGPERVSLRRAREYIEANIQCPIRMADVCSNAGVRMRTLERLFKRELDLSPTRYILARRLAGVRRQLMRRDQETDGVTRVALDHGFGHLGRFAGEYRRYFGETPSETLKRSSAVQAQDAFWIANNSGSSYHYVK